MSKVGDSKYVKVFLDRVTDLSLPEPLRQTSLAQAQAVLPTMKLFLLPGASGALPGEELFVYVDEGKFETIPRSLRAAATHIEEVFRNGSAVIYKTRFPSTTLPRRIERTTQPDWKWPEKRTAWDRILEDD